MPMSSTGLYFLYWLLTNMSNEGILPMVYDEPSSK